MIEISGLEAQQLSINTENPMDKSLGRTDQWTRRYPRFGSKVMIEMSSSRYNSYLQVHRISWGTRPEEPMNGRTDI
jgi:hypothetical protein